MQILRGAIAAIAMLTGVAHAGERWIADVPGWRLAGGGDSYRDYDAGLARDVHHGGRASAFLRPSVVNPRPGGCLFQVVDPAPYRGKRIQLSAWLKTDHVGAAGLWLRVQGAGLDAGPDFAHDAMHDRAISGTTEWQRYRIIVDVDPGARALAFGDWVESTGIVWADDFRIDVVDRSVSPTAPGAPINPDFER